MDNIRAKPRFGILGENNREERANDTIMVEASALEDQNRGVQLQNVNMIAMEVDEILLARYL